MALHYPSATICLSVVITTGIICNVFAITLIYVQKTKKLLKEKIVLVLCCINLCQTIGYIMELTFSISNDVQTCACVAEAFIICFSTYTIIAYICTLIMERYMAIVHPFLYLSSIPKRIVTFMCLLIPLLYGLFFGAAPMLGWGKYGQARINSTYCSFDFTDRSYRAKSFFYTAVICCFIVPITITVFCYVSILRELRSAAKKVTKSFGKMAVISRDSNKRTQENYISSILTGVVYMASWLPYGIVCFLFYYETHVPSSIEYFAIFMSKSATTSSPVIFCLMEKRVRRYILREHSAKMELSPILKSNVNINTFDCGSLPTNVK